MKVANLGYNPINQIGQNYKSKQQNNPAFKGEITGFTSDLANIPQLWKKITTVALYIQSITHQLSYVRSEVLSSKKIFAILSFDSCFDKEAEKLVGTLNAESEIQNLPLHFEFKKNNALN